MDFLFSYVSSGDFYVGQTATVFITGFAGTIAGTVEQVSQSATVSGNAACKNIIGCLDVPTSGTYLLGGQDVERHERAKLALELVGLSDKLKHRPNQLSGGQQQRASIARALVGEPAVILADEPTGALDSHTSREVLSLLQKIHEAGNTVVLITHDNSIAVQAQRIIRLEDGRVIYDGDARAPEAVVRPNMAGKDGGSL